MQRGFGLGEEGVRYVEDGVEGWQLGEGVGLAVDGFVEMDVGDMEFVGSDAKGFGICTRKSVVGLEVTDNGESEHSFV